MKTDIRIVGGVEHIAFEGNMSLLDLHLLLARRTTSKVTIARDIVLDLSTTIVTASVHEISTFIEFLTGELLAKLGTRRLIVVTGSKRRFDIKWETIGVAAINKLAASHDRFGVVSDIAEVNVASVKKAAESAPSVLAERLKMLSFEMPDTDMDVSFEPAVSIS